MSQDDFLDGLKGDWQSRSADLRDAASQVEAQTSRMRGQKRARLLQAGLFGTLAAAFFAAAIMLSSFLFHLGATAFLAATIMLLIDYGLLHVATGKTFLEETSSVLARAEKQARVALRLTEAMLAGAMLLLVCALIVIGGAWLGRVEWLQAILLGAVWITAAVAALLGYAKNKAEAAARLAHILAMQREMIDVE